MVVQSNSRMLAGRRFLLCDCDRRRQCAGNDCTNEYWGFHRVSLLQGWI